MLKGAKIVALLSIILASSGCSWWKPWVKPYERGILAEPVMAFESHPVSAKFLLHVYEAREGARGADGSAGGGCGCN